MLTIIDVIASPSFESSFTHIFAFLKIPRNWRFTNGDSNIVFNTLSKPSCKACQCSNPQPTSFTPSVLYYPTTPDSITSEVSTQVESTVWVQNFGSNPQTVTTTFQFTSTTTNTIVSELTTTTGQKLELGLPKFIPATGKMEFSASESWKDSTTKTGTVTNVVTYTLAQSIPAFTNQSVTARSSLSTITCTVRRCG